MTEIDRKLSIAPMMDLTDRHDRFFLRCLSENVLLYSEMITCGAVIHGDRNYLLGFNAEEHPVALQLGGSNAEELAEAAKIAEDFGYDEINLNVGCPSDRVQSGRFGACLMAEPQLVAECVAAMCDAVSLPVTVKTRLGIDDLDNDDYLHTFVNEIAKAGCDTWVIHARKAWLQGLSPKENRDIPPLQYERVYFLKETFPHLHITLNGGVLNIDETLQHLECVDGVMIGREAYQNPYFLAEVDKRVFGVSSIQPSRTDIVHKMLQYIEEQLSLGAKLSHVTRHMLGLFNGMPGARRWRRHLSEHAIKPGAGPEVLLEALAQVESF
ncbi:MAG: tRNA dihydrouridine(20/20a) synthase DusA [Pseudomonadota bacterium]